MAVYYLDKENLFYEVKKNIIPTKTVLDIGCGINPQKIFKPQTHVCLEPFNEYTDNLQKNDTNNEYLILKGTWDDAVNLFPQKSIDTIFLLDVIEHLNKEESLELLKKTEKIARVQVIIFTTLGFLPQSHPDGKDAWGLNGAAWQEHKSGWDTVDFDKNWDLYISKKYHFVNNLGENFENPYGAIWAIKTIKKSNLGFLRKVFIIMDFNIVNLIKKLKRIIKNSLT